jgi:hypothetical protein
MKTLVQAGGSFALRQTCCSDRLTERRAGIKSRVSYVPDAHPTREEGMAT